jgi:cytoskeletal protein RodZ
MLTAGLWLVVTMVSTAIVWTATSTVAADVTDRPAPVVPHRDVVSQLQSSPPEPRPPTTATRPSTSTTRPRTTVPRNAPVTAPPTTQPALSPPPASTTTVAAAPTATAPPTTQVPLRPTATYSTAGGVVRVSCDGFFIRLLSATPTDGYRVIVTAGGPVNVEVHFVRFSQDVSVKVICFGQPIRYYEDSPPTRPSFGS